MVGVLHISLEPLRFFLWFVCSLRHSVHREVSRTFVYYSVRVTFPSDTRFGPG